MPGGINNALNVIAYILEEVANRDIVINHLIAGEIMDFDDALQLREDQDDIFYSPAEILFEWIVHYIEIANDEQRQSCKYVLLTCLNDPDIVW